MFPTHTIGPLSITRVPVTSALRTLQLVLGLVG